jgi:hypothetical protein
VGCLHIERLERNLPGSETERLYGEFAVLADQSKSHDLGRQLSAEALLRAFAFETDRPIKYGASIGQSLQTLRVLNEDDERVLDAMLGAILTGRECPLARPMGLWTKCDSVFADYFLKNWTCRREPMAFLLYDPPPLLPDGAPVFIHSDKSMRLIARFREGQFVSGHKLTVDRDERMAERERIWSTYRAGTFDAPSKSDFDRFWESQHGVRGLFIMDNVVCAPQAVAFKLYGRALGWGYPMGVGYRYLTMAQTILLLRMIESSSTDLSLSFLGLCEGSRG